MTAVLMAHAERTALLTTAIDTKLAELSGRQLVSTAEVQDFLLDLRAEVSR